MDYRSLPRIANTDLTEFKNVIFGYRPKRPAKALTFGTILHELILERQRDPADLIQALSQEADRKLVLKLVGQVRQDRFCRWALQFSRKEAVQVWEDEATGLRLKSKLDIVHKNRLIVDIKSTSQPTYAGFLRSLTTYDYDRQAAFYADSIGAKRFVFVGVQKVNPFHIWTVEYHPAGSFIESGRKKYRALLREWKKREQAGQPFIPSSWASTNPLSLC